MSLRATTAKIASLGLALATHGAVIGVLTAPETVQIEGSADGSEIRLGNAFADMVAGVQTHQSVDDVVEPDPVEETAHPVEPETLEPHKDAPETAAQTEQDRQKPGETTEASPEAEMTETHQTEVVETKPEITLAAVTKVVAEASNAVVPLTPTLKPLVSATAPSPEVTEEPATQATPVAQTPTLLTSKPVQTLTATPAATVIKARPDPKPKPKPKPAAVQQGTSTVTARAGVTTGSTQTQSVSTGTNGRTRAAGNAAASNYPGIVMRCISRARRIKSRVRGSVRISFSVSSGGSIGGVSVSGSSGNRQLDSAAANAIRRVGRCKKPPSGAQRNFSVTVQS